jgi:hypothetical protein
MHKMTIDIVLMEITLERKAPQATRGTNTT